MAGASTRGSTAPELLLRQRLSALRRTWTGVRTGDVRAVHQARVATRRLREALPLIQAGKPGRRLQRAARELTQALGPVRELDVALGMLTELDRQADVPAAALSCLRRAVAQERRALHRALVGRLDEGDLDKLQRKALAAMGKHPVRGTRRAARQEQLAATRLRAARRAGRLDSAIEAAGGIYLPERLHDVRIAVKKLRYALEIGRDLTGARSETRIRSLKKTQDLLGRMHDLEVLIARTRALQAAAVRDLRLSSDLDALVRRLETECRQLHGQYIAGRRALLDLCDRVAAAASARQVA